MIARAEMIARILVVVVVVAGIGVYGIVNLQSLYADGSYQLWFHLTTGQFVVDPARWIAEGLAQVPILLALGAGVTDPGVLAMLMTAGTVGLPLAAWIGAMVLLFRRDGFWLMVAIFAVSYLNTGFMPGGYNLVYALVALSAALIVQERMRWSHLVALLAVAVVLTRSYEAVVYLAPILALTLAFRAFGRSHGLAAPTRRQIVIVGLTLLAYLAGTVLSGISILFPRVVGNRTGAADLATPFFVDGQLAVSFLIACGVVGLTLLASTRRGAGAVTWVGSAILGLAIVAFFANPENWAEPSLHYLARTLAGLFLAVLIVAFLAVNLVWRPPKDSPRVAVSAVWPVAVLLVVAQAIPFAVHISSFARWLGVVEQTVLQASGPVPVTATALGESTEQVYMWPWTNPYLSRLVQDDPGDGVLVNPPEYPGDPLPGPIPERYLRPGDSILPY